MQWISERFSYGIEAKFMHKSTFNEFRAYTPQLIIHKQFSRLINCKKIQKSQLIYGNQWFNLQKIDDSAKDLIGATYNTLFSRTKIYIQKTNVESKQ